MSDDVPVTPVMMHPIDSPAVPVFAALAFVVVGVELLRLIALSPVIGVPAEDGVVPRLTEMVADPEPVK